MGRPIARIFPQERDTNITKPTGRRGEEFAQKLLYRCLVMADRANVKDRRHFIFFATPDPITPSGAVEGVVVKVNREGKQTTASLSLRVVNCQILGDPTELGYWLRNVGTSDESRLWHIPANSNYAASFGEAAAITKFGIAPIEVPISAVIMDHKECRGWRIIRREEPNPASKLNHFELLGYMMQMLKESTITLTPA